MAFVLLKFLKAHRRIAPLNINASLVPDPFPHNKNKQAPANAEAKNMVGEEGFEPPTLWSQTRCATKLRYSPSIGSCNASQRGRMLLIIRL